MNIKTKLDIGDQIWFIANNHKANHSVVRGISIIVTADKPDIVTYLVTSSPDERVYLKIDECNAHKSKKDLLESI